MKALILTGLLLTGAVYAQCPAPETFVKEKSKVKEAYEVNSQSRSGSVRPGETYEMSFIAQNGMDYRLSMKAANGAEGTLSYEIYEMVVEKKTVNGKTVYKRSRQVLASSGDNASTPLEFSTDKARKVFVAVTLTGGDPKKTQCVGVLIEDKKSTKLGF